MDLNQTKEPRFSEEEMEMVDRLQNDPESEFYYNDPEEETLLDKIKRKLGPLTDEGKDFLEYLFSPGRHFGTGQYNKGGAVMDDQMKMAFMDEGGIADDGMDVDPVSGNEVPPGSLAEEVRDDIPAQLSEGEYVVPADVVRYYGVKFFEDLRDQAKMGLAEMEANGRIGGEPVPAGGPINDEELSPQEMQAIQEMMGANMNEGGQVQNPYLQQQQLYSQPRPAPIDEKRNTTLTNINPNPVENQMPMQSMASGGQVQGYQPGGPVTPAQDQMMYAQNTFNPFNYGAGYSFMGPTTGTGTTGTGTTGTGTTGTGTTGTGTPGAGTSLTPTIASVTGEVPMMTLYGPNGEIRTFSLPLSEADAEEVTRLKDMGYSETKSVTTAPVSTVGDGSSPKSSVEADPNSWMEKFDYTDMSTLSSQTSDTLNKSPVNTFIKGQNVAEAAANIIILEANLDTGDEVGRKKVDDLKADWKKFVDDDIFLKNLPQQLINGDKLAKEIVLNNPGKDIGLTYKDKKGVTTKDLFGNDLFKDENDFNNFMQKTASEAMTFDSTSGSYKREGSPSITTATSAVAATGPKIRPETIYDSATGKTIVVKPTAPKAPPVKTQAQKDDAASNSIKDWVSATNATKGKKGIERHKAIKAQSDASRKATAAIREASGYNKKNKGGLMNKKGKK